MFEQLHLREIRKSETINQETERTTARLDAPHSILSRVSKSTVRWLAAHTASRGAPCHRHAD